MIINMTDDFNLSRIADSGQCFRWQKLDENRYRILHGAYCLYIDDLGECQYNLSCDENQYKKIWKEYFDTETNYREIRKKIDPMTDPFLWAAAEAEKGIRILRQDPWEMLITFIISQNRNIPAIKNSVELLVETCGEYKEDDRGISYHAFPTPEAISSLSESELISCRLGYRWKYVRSAAKAVTDRNIDLDALMDTDEESTISSLTNLYGVGNKVANCVSLFGLHHLNAFPRDVWIKRILEQKYPNGYPFESYSPYNGVYQQYMFAYYRNQALGI